MSQKEISLAGTRRARKALCPVHTQDDYLLRYRLFVFYRFWIFRESRFFRLYRGAWSLNLRLLWIVCCCTAIRLEVCLISCPSYDTSFDNMYSEVSRPISAQSATKRYSGDQVRPNKCRRWSASAPGSTDPLPYRTQQII